MEKRYGKNTRILGFISAGVALAALCLVLLLLYKNGDLAPKGPVFKIEKSDLEEILLVSNDYGEQKLEGTQAEQALELLNGFTYSRTAKQTEPLLPGTSAQNWVLLQMTDGTSMKAYFDADWMSVQDTIYYGESGYFEPLLLLIKSGGE